MPVKAKNVASKSMFVPLSPKRNFEEVANQIKELILSGQLKPLERLPSERDMAEQFNASRNTVREAYRILEETGFIRMKTGNTGGAMVCTPRWQKDHSIPVGSCPNGQYFPSGNYPVQADA